MSATESWTNLSTLDVRRASQENEYVLPTFIYYDERIGRFLFTV